ncbi:MAG: hypothetical protein KJO08_02210 [Gammaproteobacteria bacterium]|nr:hypothetical protein [Gammaproteobacteria bacterium]NNJ84152.1 hypothetical protein [Gammaproteobacteria bacterium]
MLTPEPPPGLRETAFRKICENGFGDGYNAYAYSAVWFREHLYIGTSRANLCLLKFAMPFVRIDTWPVDCPYQNYTRAFERLAARGEIWRYDPITSLWERLFRAPFVRDGEGVRFSRDLGYRGMTVFQGRSDQAPALYVASWARSRGQGPEILRSTDGRVFTPVAKPRFKSAREDITVTAIRALTPYKGRLFTAPTGASKGNVNMAWTSLIFETADPVSGQWYSVNDPGFERPPEVAVIYEMAVCHDYLYAGTGGINGFQIWRTQAEGSPPYKWEKILSNGAGRGALNQGVVSMIAYKDCLYVGTGIQNGGYDHRWKIGPAAAEIIRIHADGQWDIVIGSARDGKEPISGFGAGFNNYFCGYIWRMGIHEGWLYVGTMDWSVILRFVDLENKPMKSARLLAEMGVERFIDYQGGFDLWRTWDGENWLPVTKTGFGNPFNYGCRNIVSTPHGLFICTANPFGPKVATRIGKEWKWAYRDNPHGGLEVWQGG